MALFKPGTSDAMKGYVGSALRFVTGPLGSAYGYAKGAAKSAYSTAKEAVPFAARGAYLAGKQKAHEAGEFANKAIPFAARGAYQAGRSAYYSETGQAVSRRAVSAGAAVYRGVKAVEGGVAFAARGAYQAGRSAFYSEAGQAVYLTGKYLAQRARYSSIGRGVTKFAKATARGLWKASEKASGPTVQAVTKVGLKSTKAVGRAAAQAGKKIAPGLMEQLKDIADDANKLHPRKHDDGLALAFFAYMRNLPDEQEI